MMPVERTRWLILGLLLIAVVGYYLPWSWHSAAGLSPGAYDLAEWTTLDPATRSGAPPLLPSFFLRGALGLLAVLCVLAALEETSPPIRWTFYATALVLGLTLLPPLDFLTSARDDPNYRQQFVLAAVTLVLVLLTAWLGKRLPQNARRLASAAVALAALAGALVGLSGGLALMQSFGIGSRVGGGAVLFALDMVLLAVVGMSGWWQARGQTPGK